jgi:hypothetical protein
MTEIAKNKADIAAMEEREGFERDILKAMQKGLDEIEYAAGWAEDILGPGGAEDIICNAIIELHKLREKAQKSSQ